MYLLIAERRRRLLEEVRQRGYSSFRELADALDISESTVRRDLRLMVSEGLLASTRGGVGPAGPAGPGSSPAGGGFSGSPSGFPGSGSPGSGSSGSGPSGAGPTGSGPSGAGFPGTGHSGSGHPGSGHPGSAHSGSGFPGGAAAGFGGGFPVAADDDPVFAEREAIAAFAATLVEPGSAVLLGPGRTTTALARRLTTVARLTVVTNSVTVTQALIDAPHVDVVMIGGALRRSIGALVGPITEQTLTGLRGAQVFLSGEGVTVDRGLTTPNVFAAATDQALMAAGRQVVVLADHTKLGHDTMCQTVPSARIDVLVTDAGAEPGELRRLSAAGITVHVARA